MTRTSPPFAGIRAVFFDAVGTLLHPDPPAADVYAAVGCRHGSRLGVGVVESRFAQAFHSQDHFDARDEYRTSEDRELRRWRTIVAEVLDDVPDAQRCFAELHAHFAEPSAWRCAARTGAALEALAARGFLVGIASNFDHRLRRLVAEIPDLHAVARVVISTEVGWRKPAAEFFAAVVSAASLPPEQILFVGDDWENDYVGALAAGLRPILFGAQRKGSPDTQHTADLSELLGLLAQ
jgi:putative hydrolase of the HAD superfamily